MSRADSCKLDLANTVNWWSWRLAGGAAIGAGVILALARLGPDLGIQTEALRGMAIFLGTFVSEDAASVAAGYSIVSGQMNLATGLCACFIGIFLGDLGLWILGHRMAAVLRRGGIVGPMASEKYERAASWLHRFGSWTIVLARFVPGLRVPVYVAAGYLRWQPLRFAWLALAAGAVWTPLLILTVVWLGPAAVEPLQQSTWLAICILIGVIIGGWLLLWGLGQAMISGGFRREKILATVARLWRYEFWPAWVFYLPLIPYWAFLALRYRSLTVWTLANPGLAAAGGVVGESKFQILQQLPVESVLPAILLPGAPESLESRLERMDSGMRSQGLEFPVVMKPDSAQRGTAVRIISNRKAALAYLAASSTAVVIQAYHPGPFEAGVFYYRFPDAAEGQIFSITDKVFPVLSGDGRSTVEQLIWRDSRLRMQARVFRERHFERLGKVLAAGETYPLVRAGNHCQGTLFLDGAHLVTPELRERIDQIAKSLNGFFIGRFDIRYTNIEKFKQGTDLAIVELNGVTSESTNIYDPRRSLRFAYGTLGRQWKLLFSIGAAVRSRHRQQPVSAVELGTLIWRYFRSERATGIAD